MSDDQQMTTQTLNRRLDARIDAKYRRRAVLQDEIGTLTDPVEIAVVDAEIAGLYNEILLLQSHKR
jgi:hypothetical protein